MHLQKFIVYYQIASQLYRDRKKSLENSSSSTLSYRQSEANCISRQSKKVYLGSLEVSNLGMLVDSKQIAREYTPCNLLYKGGKANRSSCFPNSCT